MVYSVEVQFLQQGSFSAPAAGIANLHEKTEKWTKSLFSGAEGFAGKFNGALDSIGSAFLDVGAKAATGLATAFGVGAAAATKMAFSYNEQMENTTIALGAIANANETVGSLGGGMRLAGDVIKEMRKDAAKLPGEFKDLEGIMLSISSAGAQMGVGMWGMEKMAAKTMTAAEILKVPQNVAGREMAMMLEGNARHSMPMFTRLGMGMDTKSFNALAPKARFDKITESLDKLNPAVAMFQNSWMGIRTTAVDSIRQGIGAVGGPLFGSVKDLVKGLSSGIATNKNRLIDFGFALSMAIDNGFNRGVEAIKHWYPIVETFAETFYDRMSSVWHRLSPLMTSLFGKLERFMSDPTAFDKVIHAAEVFAGLRIGGAVAEKGFGLAGSAAKGIMGIAGGGEAGIAAVGAAAIPAAIAVAGLAVATYGVVDMLADGGNQFHGSAVNLAKSIDSHVTGMAGQWAELGSSLKVVADLLGLGLLTALNQVISTVESVGWALNGLIGMLDARRWIGLAGLKDNSQMSIDVVHELAPMFMNQKLNAPAERELDRKIPQSVTHIHKVEIKVNSNQDPNRIAKRTADILQDLARHPKSAALSGVPNYSPVTSL